MIKIKRAIISVSNKDGLTELARGLHSFGVEIISTGGTAKAIASAGLPVINISEVTGYPEMLDGRVRTLHPAVHAGILAKRTGEHLSQLKEHNIAPLDLVVVNLYPFRETIAKGDVSLEEAIENIDIGGPTMIRSAAKNFENVVVVVDPRYYEALLREMGENDGGISRETSFELAIAAFKHTADYDSYIYPFLQSGLAGGEQFPQDIVLRFEKAQSLRYGENPHQEGVFYKELELIEPNVARAKQLQGRKLSFNNIYDLDSALAMVRDFSEPTAAVIKHTNPCGLAEADTISEAYSKAHACDPLSAFGGIVALNRKVDPKTAEQITSTFIEAVIAPEYEEEALDILTSKKNLRVLEVGNLEEVKKVGIPGITSYDMKKVVGGLLVQERDTKELTREDIKVVTSIEPTEKELADLFFAWKAVKHIKSNAIVLVKDRQTIGIGAGQMSRVDAVKIAVSKAGDRAKGSVLASDALIPFRDTVDEAAKAGVKVMIEPGGSVKDEEVIAAANEHKIAMVFTGIRHFKH